VVVDGEIADDEEAEVDTTAERATAGDGDAQGSRTPNGAVSRQNSMSRSQVAC
jgi:hypothetical protein